MKSIISTLVLMMMILLSSSSSITTTIIILADQSPTGSAQFVLDSGGITNYIGALYNISEVLPDGTTRIGAQAALKGCLRPEIYEKLAETLIFIQAKKTNVETVTECLSFCSALRRLDYWMQTPTNNGHSLPLVELASGIQRDGTCWCLPQNMTTVADIALWSRVMLGENSNNHGGSSPTTTNTPSTGTNNKGITYNDIFLPPTCCDAETNELLLKPGATFINDTTATATSKYHTCPISSQTERQSLISIFESSYSCGISQTCDMSGCVRHPDYKPPSGFVSSFDSCVPMTFPPSGYYDSSPLNTNDDDGIYLDAESIVILTAAGIVVFLVVGYCLFKWRKNKREEEARDRLLVARGAFGGSSTVPANVASLLGGSNNTSNPSSSPSSSAAAAASSSGSNKPKRPRRRYPGEEEDENASGNHQIQDLEAEREEREQARRMLSKLPTSALAKRPLEVCRLMASTIIQSNFISMETISNKNISSSKNSSSAENKKGNCPICLDSLEARADGSDEAIDRMPQTMTAAHCGHRFHTLCVFRQLVYHAQKMDVFDAERQQLAALEKLNMKEGFAASSSSTSATGAGAAAASSTSSHHHLFSPVCCVCRCDIVRDSRVIDQVEAIGTGRKVVNANPLQ